MRTIIASAMGTTRDGVPDLHKSRLADAAIFKETRAYKHHAGHYVERVHGEFVPTTHVIHIRRNPLDVFLSYLNFLSNNVTGNAPIPFDTVEEIAGTELFDAYFKSFVLLGHMSGNARFNASTRGYFEHQYFWLKESKRNESVRAIRYEDVKEGGEETLYFLTEWLGITEDQLANAMAKADANTRVNGKFFWKQQSGAWRNYITREQLEFFLRQRADDLDVIGYPAEQFT